MSMTFETNAEWDRLMRGDDLFEQANAQGLRRAGAQALKEVLQNFKKRGQPRRWKRLTDKYKKRKAAGKAAPIQEASTVAGQADLILTGALLRAAVASPRHKLTKESLEIWPDGDIRIGRSSVGEYADSVNAVRPFYALTDAAQRRIAKEYAIGFSNVLRGLEDSTGRIFR